MDKQSHITTDHDTIMDWVEARGGFPTFVEVDGIKNCRISFEDEKTLMPVGWEQFFEEFENLSLAFLYQVETEDGEESHFNAFVDRKSHEDEIAEEAHADDSSYDDGEYADAEDDLVFGDTSDSDDDEEAF